MIILIIVTTEHLCWLKVLKSRKTSLRSHGTGSKLCEKWKRHVNAVYTRKNACSVTAFNSTDIRPVQDNVATPATAMMVTVCISTDASSSVFISPDLSDTNSFHQCCWSIMPVTACQSYRLQQSCSQHTCIILLHHADTALTTQQTVPVWYCQFWTVCRRQQSDTAMISYLYQAWRCNRL